MRIMIDFTLTESRERLDHLMCDLRDNVIFELHNALAEHEEKCSDELGGVNVAIVDTDVMVNTLISRMKDSLLSVFNTPRTYTVGESAEGICSAMTNAFEEAIKTVTDIHFTDTAELYVAVVQSGISPTITDTVTWTDVLTDNAMERINKIYKAAQIETIGICRRELVYLSEKYGGVAE